LLHYVTLSIIFVGKRLAALFLPLDSSFSAISLVSAFSIAVAFLLLKRRPEKRSVKYAVMLRALFPTWLYRNASFRADVGLLLFNVLAFGALFGWAVFSAGFVRDAVSASLTTHVGVSAGIGLNNFAGKVIATAALFIAYELAYWVDHYLSHRIPLLWEFHKVHHTAEVLSPLTNFRVHPVDTIVFSNILGLFTGATEGVLSYLNVGMQFGAGPNMIFLAFVWVIGHLQHSHLWIPVTGPLGRLIMSPAHHQLHHSDNPKHYDRNFGSCLSLWDWLFGTLHMPERNRERLTFGVGRRAAREHTVVGTMFTPFAKAWKRVRPAMKSRVDAVALRTRPSPRP
jgi:sterol desaturase/sphingolipid hydroxylase (fatty acid hydroxylase superfamily)